MLNKIAAVAVVGLMAALPALPAQATTARALPDKCGFHYHNQSAYYGNCTSGSQAVYYHFGINPYETYCTTVKAFTESYIQERATLDHVSAGTC